MKKYKFLTIREMRIYFPKIKEIENEVNIYASEGWTIKTIFSTNELYGSNGKQEFVIVLEKDA